MVRKLAGALLVASALTSQYAGALGLGELKLNSALNQPLNAEIKLVNVGDLTTDQVIVKLASQLAFEQAGVERDYFLTNLKFSVHLDGRGSGVIKIKTQNLVREPYLDFLIEARWPTGKVLRGYTALVDLPVFSEKTQTSVNLGSASSSTPAPVTRQPAPQQQTTYTPPASQQRYQPVQEVDQSSTRYTTSSGGGTYEIRKSDTLWNIARDARPSSDVSVHQTMMAIQQINPGAFIKNNINLLRAGHVLRLPTEDEVREINNRRAIQQVAVQNKKWREKESVSGAQLDATGKKSSSKYSEVEGQLRLTSAEKANDEGTGGSGSNSASSASGGDSQALLEANEEKAALELQNKELSGRMSDLEAQVEKLQRLVELKNNELARLQNTVADNDSAKGLIDRGQEQAEKLAEDAKSAVESTKEGANKLAGDATRKIDGAIQGGLEKVDGKIDAALDSDAAMAAKDKLASLEDGLDGTIDDLDAKIEDSGLGDGELAGEDLGESLDGEIDSMMDAGAEAIDTLEDGADSMLNAGEDAIDAGQDKLDSAVDAGENALGSLKDQLPGSDSPEPSFIDKLLEKPMYIGGALLALLAGLFAFLFRKRGKKEDEIDESFDNSADEVGDEFDFADPETDIHEQELNPSQDASQDQDFDLDGAFDELSAETDTATTTTQPETGDAIGEADIYVAYGRYDQAADLLNNALDQDPSRDDVRLKLLEVHLESQNKEGFKAQYQQISALGNDELKGKAKELLTNIEDASEWIDLDSTGIGGIAGASALAGIGAAGAAASDLMDDKTIVQDKMAQTDELELDSFSLDTVEDASLDAIDQLDIDTADDKMSFDFDATLDLDDESMTNAAKSVDEGLDKSLQNFELDDANLSTTLDGIDLPDSADGIDLDATLDRAAEATDAGDLGASGIAAGAATSAAALMALSEQGQSEDDLTDDEEDDLNFLTQSDQVATKLDLARAYIDMGDIDGAKEILQEVVEEGESNQKEEAQGLLDQL